MGKVGGGGGVGGRGGGGESNRAVAWAKRAEKESED